jgi:hypothetical protein
MSRIAEASARAGRAVADDSHVEWANQRDAAERLLRDAPPEQAVPSRSAPSQSPLASSPAPDSVAQTFAWPPEFNLDEIDLSRDPHARQFRRPSSRPHAPHDERRFEFDEQTSRHHASPRHEPVPSSPPRRVSATSAPRRDTAISSKRSSLRDPVRAEARRVTWRRVVMVAIALIVLLASAGLLTYLLRHVWR